MLIKNISQASILGGGGISCIRDIYLYVSRIYVNITFVHFYSQIESRCDRMVVEFTTTCAIGAHHQ
jgi:hypothetical protein